MMMVSKPPFYFIAILIFVFSQAAGQSQDQKHFDILDQIDSLLDEDQNAKAKTLLDSTATWIKDHGSRPLSIYFHQLHGDYYFQVDQYEQAATAYEPLLQITTADLAEEPTIRLGRALNDLGIAYMKTGNFDAAIHMHYRSLGLYNRFENYQGGSYNYNNLGIIYQELKQLDSALSAYRKGKIYAELAHDTLGMGYYALNLAILYNDNKEPIKSLKHFQEALRIFSAQNHEAMINTTRRIMARHYFRIRDYDLGLAILTPLLCYYKSKGASDEIGDTYEGMAEAYLNMDMLDSAKVMLDSALKYVLPSHYAKGISKSYHLIGRYFYDKNQLDSALHYYHKSQQYNNDNLKGMQMVNLIGISKIYLDLNRYDLAISSVNLGLENVSYSASINSLSDAYEILYKAYKAKGDETKALESLELMNAERQKLFGEEKAMEMARIEYQNELQRAENLRKAEQARQEIIHANELSKQRWISIIVMLVAALLVVILVLIYRSNHAKKIANAMLQDKNNKLQALRVREKALSEEALAAKDRALAASAMATHEKNSLYQELEQKIASMEQASTEALKLNLQAMRKTIANSYSLDKSWDSFVHRFEDVHPGFFDQLKGKHPKLTINDLKLSAYLKVGMNNKEIANVTHLTLGSVKSKINRLKKKLDMSAEDNIRDFLMG